MTPSYAVGPRFGFGMMFRFGTSDPERLAAVDGARRCLNPADRRWRPLLTGLLASHMIFDTAPTAVARRRALAAEVTATVEDPATPVEVLVDLARCRLFLSIAEPARLDRVMRRIAGPAEARRDLTALFEVWFALAWAALERGDMRRLEDAVGEMAAVNEQAHSLHSGAFVALIRGAMAIITGRYEEAEKLGLRARELFELSGNPNTSRLYGSQVMVRAFDDGRAGDVLPFLRQAAAEVDLPPLAAATDWRPPWLDRRKRPGRFWTASRRWQISVPWPRASSGARPWHSGPRGRRGGGGRARPPPLRAAHRPSGTGHSGGRRGRMVGTDRTPPGGPGPTLGPGGRGRAAPEPSPALGTDHGGRPLTARTASSWSG